MTCILLDNVSLYRILLLHEESQQKVTSHTFSDLGVASGGIHLVVQRYGI